MLTPYMTLKTTNLFIKYANSCLNVSSTKSKYGKTANKLFTNKAKEMLPSIYHVNVRSVPYTIEVSKKINKKY